MEENPMIMKELPKRYVKALNNLMFAYMDYRRWDECFEMINKLKGLIKKPGFESMDVQLKLFTSSHNAELLACINMGDFEKAKTQVIPEILKQLAFYEGKINSEEEMLFYYNISSANFGAQDYKGALKYINLVLNTSEAGLREDVYTFARLVNLIIHYELGNYDLLDYTIKSTKRFVAKNQRNYKFETVFLKDFKKLLKVRNTGSPKQLYIDFKAALEKVLEDPYEQAANEYFNFIAWLDSKIQNKPYEQIIQGKLKK